MGRIVSTVGSFSDRVVRRVVSIIADRKGKGIVVIDISKFKHITDFFVLCTAESSNHRKAIVEKIQEEFKKEKIPILNVDFNPDSPWSLIDCGDVVVHIFEEDSRRFYDIEGLWADAEQIKVDVDNMDNVERLRKT